MEVHEADPKVNKLRNIGAELFRKATEAAEDGRLPL